MKKKSSFLLFFSLLIVIESSFFPLHASAQTPTKQVTPTPLLVQGETPSTGVDLSLSPTFLSLITDPGAIVNGQFKVTNNNNFTEYLRLHVAKFTPSVDGDSPVIADIEAGDEFAEWIKFSENEFALAPNQTKTITLTISPSQDAALGYYYAVVVQRLKAEASGDQQTVISGSPALSVLLNVKSDSVVRELQVEEFTTDALFYEYLPTTFNVKVKNTGNIHAVPVGDIFIDQGGQKDIAVLQANKGRGNVLPQSTRTFTASWDDGFAVRVPKLENGQPILGKDGKPEFKTEYDFTKADKFRIGKYTANLLLVYDNGERDVPIEAQVSFWIIPWKILFISGVVLIFVILGIKSTVASNIKRILRIFHG